MKKLVLPFLIALTLLLSGFSAFYSLQWKIADGYVIQFSSSNPSGEFTALKGDILFDAADLAHSKFDVSVEVNSINTGNGLKNKHAKGANWFDADKYPTITYQSNEISATAAGYEAMGILEMHGIKKDFTIPFTFADNTFKSSFDVDRMDFKIGTTQGMSANVPTIMHLDLAVPVSQ